MCRAFVSQAKGAAQGPSASDHGGLGAAIQIYSDSLLRNLFAGNVAALGNREAALARCCGG
jgi:hypothetical protein